MEARNATGSLPSLTIPVKPTTFIASVTVSQFIAAAVVYILGYGLVVAAQKPRLPALPQLGNEGKSWLARQFSSFRHLTQVRDWAKEGYYKYNKNGESFILPGAPGMPSEIVIPREQMGWLLDKPDNIVSVSEAHYELLHGRYAFINPNLIKFPYHEHVLHRSLARNLNGLIPVLEDEVKLAIDEVLGLNENEWKSVNIWDTLLAVIPRFTNRMLLGLPVGRNKTFLQHMVSFTNAVVANMFLLTAVPTAVLPIVGRIAGLPSWYHWKKTSHYSLPVIKQRLHDMARRDAGDPEYKDWQPPNDYVTWHIRTAKSEGRIDELDPTIISQRLPPMNFASIHTTTLTGHATLLDLLSSDPSRGYLEDIQEEIDRVWAEEGGVATRDGLARLYRIDSAIRESMRISALGTTMVARRVVAEEGITNDAEGWHAPKGSAIAVNFFHMTRDDDVYSDPHSYDAFRHSRGREEWEAKQKEDKVDTDEALRHKQSSMVTTSPTHFAFGHGRHSCPGRFFVAHELKILFAYIFTNYEIKRLPERPKTRWFGSQTVPATDARMEIRRKPGTSSL